MASPVRVRAAVESDLPALVGLCAEMREQGGRAERALLPTARDVETRLLEVVADPRARVLLAEVDGGPAGMAVLCVVRSTPLNESDFVQLSNLVVRAGLRRRGVASLLVEEAAQFALEHGLDSLMVGVYPTLREVNRFFARLGFAPAATQRVASVSGLLRQGARPRGARYASTAVSTRQGRAARLVRVRRRVDLPTLSSVHQLGGER